MLKKCTEGPCVVLCGIKNCKNWKRAFSKSTPVYPRLLWTKALPISKKSFFLEKKNLFCLSKLSIKINAPYYIHVFLLYIKDEIYGDRAVFFTILWYTSMFVFNQIEWLTTLFPSLLKPQDFDFISNNAELRTQTL